MLLLTLANTFASLLKRSLWPGLALLFTPALALHAEERFLVKNGEPRAEIVIAEKPLRTVRLAAQQLQDGIEKISGGHLPIVTTPSAQRAHVFVGRSEYTEKLKLPTENVNAGAYCMVSGEDWLALVGEDTEFTPIEPWAKSNAELVSGKPQREWDAITGAQWGLPNPLIYKDRFTVPGETGLPDALRPSGRLTPLELWSFDERGSFNAVCGFLMKLGVRWFAPGKLGEFIPASPSIVLSKFEEIIRPDFPIRRLNIRFGVHGAELAMWAMRLGFRDPYDVQCAHGMDEMTHRDEIFEKHPEWFALYGGKRQTQKEQRLNHLCYSNEELIAETVRNVRAQFDHYQFEMVSVMPPDGYTAICQCPLCAGKDSPERDPRGLASDYVWGFVNRVAKEVGKTHPNKKVLNCAYGIYSLPPLKIEKLEPNVVVSIVGGRRPINNTAPEQEEVRKLRESWLAKTDNPIVVFENYPFTDRGWYLPSFTAHSLGASINATKGISQGEDVWLSIAQNFETNAMGFNHFLIYFTQRMYWGGKEASLEKLFCEYVELFYGPAAPQMKTFFDFCEANWQAMEKDKDTADSALALFAQAQSKAEPSSLCGQRLALLDDYLKGLRNKSQQLGRMRGPVPVLRLVGDPHGKILIDGKLDEEAWQNCPAASTCRLRELQTGRQPIFETSVKSLWIGHDLYFAIRCEEHRGEKVNDAATRKDDSALWYGDSVEVLIETESHSYYQIAISPGGIVADLDRSAARKKWLSWDSNAEVATHIADDHWTIEMRLPITPDENDPLHQIIGKKPTKSLPWHLNICRQRIREDGTELSAFSPTGAETFHNPMKFATFFDGNSFEFDHAPPDADFLEAMRGAGELVRTGKRDAALGAYTSAAEGKISQLQKSYALERAATVARGLHKPDVSAELIARIPNPAIKKSAQMQQLLDEGQAPRLISQFAADDISSWPFWNRGAGFFSRGRAYALTKAGQEAERDLGMALEWLSDLRLRDEALLALAQNKEANLQDNESALRRYHQIIDNQTQLGTATQFYAIHGIANIESKRGRHAEALAILKRVDARSLQGFWRDQFRLWQAEALEAAGRTQEAVMVYKVLAGDQSADNRMRKVAQEKLGAKGGE